MDAHGQPHDHARTAGGGRASGRGTRHLDAVGGRACRALRAVRQPVPLCGGREGPRTVRFGLARTDGDPVLPGGLYRVGATGHGDVATPPTQSGLHRQRSLHPGLALRGPGRPGDRRRLAQRRIRRTQCAVGEPRCAHRRVHRGPAHALVRRQVFLQGRDLHLGRVRDVPQADSATPSSHPHRWGVRRGPPAGRPGRPGMAHLQPVSRRTGRGPGQTRRARGRRRAEPGRPPHHRLPVFPPAHAGHGGRVRRSRGRCGVRPLFCFSADDVEQTFDGLDACREAAARS